MLLYFTCGCGGGCLTNRTHYVNTGPGGNVHLDFKACSGEDPGLLSAANHLLQPHRAKLITAAKAITDDGSWSASNPWAMLKRKPYWQGLSDILDMFKPEEAPAAVDPAAWTSEASALSFRTFCLWCILIWIPWSCSCRPAR